MPLEAVLRGIDAAFEKWRAKRSRAQLVNSLAFCSQAVMPEAQRMADAGSADPAAEGRQKDPSPFPADELRRFIEKNASAIRAIGIMEFEPVAAALDQILSELADLAPDPEKLEQRLSVLEQKLVALARSRQTDHEALATRTRLDAQLGPYKSRMTAPQIAMLESQFLDRALLESFGLPRLSLFYLS